MAELKLVKIGGNVIENREALADFLADFDALSGQKILVHGGGKEATQMAKKLGINVQDSIMIPNFERFLERLKA